MIGGNFCSKRLGQFQYHTLELSYFIILAAREVKPLNEIDISKPRSSKMPFAFFLPAVIISIQLSRCLPVKSMSCYTDL